LLWGGGSSLAWKKREGEKEKRRGEMKRRRGRGRKWGWCLSREMLIIVVV
jgi:hypothetical protein